MKHIFTIIFFFIIYATLSALSTSPTAEVSLLQDPEKPKLAIVSPTVTNISDLKVKIYPNPATDYIRVEWETEKKLEVYVELYDLVGRRVSQKKSEESINRIHMDLKSLQRSAYLLKVFTADGKYTRTYRVVKN